VLLLLLLLLLLKITYLQAGASSVTAAWSSSSLKSDAIRVGAQFRAEVQPLLQSIAAGQFTQQDLAAASQLLADVAGQQTGPLPPPSPRQQRGGEDEGTEDVGMEVEGSGSCRDEGAARVLMDWLLRRPLGEVLLSYAAVPNSSWSPGETEYGR
jgi:hypothetical protein